MSKYARSFDVERGSVDPEKGTFRAVVFSDGEASDGHRLRMSGAEVPESMPLFVNHEPDPRTQLGTLHFERKTAHEVLMRGEIFTGGEGSEAEIRRDLLAKMAAGHVSQMSGRWGSEDADTFRRADLPSDDEFYVDKDLAKRDAKYRYGLVFNKWHALEGSVVGLGADHAAVVRFAEDEAAPESVREFWRSVAEHESEEDTSESEEAVAEPVEEPPIEPEITREEPEIAPVEAVEPLDDEGILDLFRDSVAQLLERGLPFEVLTEAVESQRKPEPPPIETLMERIDSLEQQLGEFKNSRVTGTADGPTSAQDLLDKIQEGRREQKQELVQMMTDYVATRRGAKIEDEARAAAVAEFSDALRKLSQRGKKR